MNLKVAVLSLALSVIGCVNFGVGTAQAAKGTSRAHGSNFVTNDWINQEIQAACKNKTTKYSILVRDLKTGEETYLNPMRQRSASLIKVYIMGEAYKLKKAGKLDFNELVTIKKADQRAWGSLDKVPDGTKVPVHQLIEQMIVVSDNTATNLMIDKLGYDRINGFIKSIGCTDTVCGRKMLDSAAAKAGHDNWTSPKDMAHIFELMYKGKLVDPKSDKEMINILCRQQWNERIPGNLPHDLRIAHKTGELGDALHDCGIVFGRNRDYILCMMTANVPNANQGYDDNNAVEFNDMALISKLIWNKIDDPVLAHDGVRYY
jgi:beta-lactamase class A